MRTAAIIELNLLDRMVPLVGGYLEAYARTDSALAKNYRFSKYANTARAGKTTLLKDLLNLDADIYAFSCYVWNSALVALLIAEIRQRRPGARFLLGGPQVMHRAEKYIGDDSAIAVNNGEGEISFAHYLRELTEPRPDLSRVPGISYFADGQIVTTSPCPRISTLDSIPSPFLENLFPGDYSLSVFETNRGCPFRCGFCYWGAATNDRVYKFSDERIRAEIEWLSKKGVLYIYVADANWGMLKRDVELTRHMAECSRSFGAPTQLYFSAAKNSPDRVFEITQICHAANMVVAQPVSLQTLSDEALRMVDRQNIKLASYLKLQSQLDDLNISSVTELIWPLPGETLASFKAGVESLCESGNSMLIAHPHLLLPNTPLDHQRSELGLKTIQTLDGVGEAELIVGTCSLSRDEFEAGFRYFYAAHLLHNAHALRRVAAYTDRAGIESRGEVFTSFANYLSNMRQCRVADFIATSSKGGIGTEIFPYGQVVHYALHEDRTEFVSILRQFMSTRPYWSNENVRMLFELDQVCLPYLYATTPLAPESSFGRLSRVALRGRVYELTIPARFSDLIGRHEADHDGAVFQYRVDHARGQFPLMRSQSIEHHAGYCQEAIRIGSVIPVCTVRN